MAKIGVKNAADENQVERAGKSLENRRHQELSDIRTVLASASGRRLLWRLMEKCRTFSSVWDNSARIHYNAGQQDIGHYVMAEIVDADENLLFKMMKEQKTEE